MIKVIDDFMPEDEWTQMRDVVMLPHNALGRQLFRKLKVYKGPDHPHSAQQPKIFSLNSTATF